MLKLRHRLFFAVAIISVLFSADLMAQTTSKSASQSDSTITPTPAYSRAERMIAAILEQLHYRKIAFSDSLSSEIFDRFLELLDYNRVYFFDQDIARFEKYRVVLDDNLKLGILNPPYELFNLFKKRVEEREAWVQDRLKTPFDFTIDESYFFKREKKPWPRTQKEMDEVWRKMLKNQALNLKLSGKDEKGIVETLSNRFKNQLKRINQYNREDVFRLYVNAITTSIDPHTSYFSPMDSDNFKISMSLSFEGIGARLQTENDYTLVYDIIPGGPAFKSKKLKKGDKIIGVGQGKDGKIQDVIGWRLDEVVKLIRGKKGTTVQLQIIPEIGGPDAQPKIIRIVRDKVKLEEQAAKKKLITLNYNNKAYKIGIITIPTFYLDFEAYRRGDPNYKSTNRDVRKLLSELKQEQVQGIIIDLRNNGGGSLEEAIQLTGLFIPDGPVVQVKKSNGIINVHEDEDPDVVYDGPLAVLVNRYSASASEIFAAALQDYHRGLIIGEQTYGKGTVQNLVDLNHYLRFGDHRYGQLKLTIAKFYRISGESTQQKGVFPDIQLPSPVNHEEFGEDAEPSALPWDHIESALFQHYTKVPINLISSLQNKHNQRILKDDEFRLYLKEIDHLKKNEKKDEVTLMETKRKAERDALKALQSSQINEPESETDKKEENDEKSENDTKPDILLDETTRILADMIAMI